MTSPSPTPTQLTINPLLQPDIIDQVLSHCASPQWVQSISCLPVPSDCVWFATAARTCQAWLQPALRRLYHTVNLDAYNERYRYILSPDIIARIGHRVRTLVVCDYSELAEQTCAYGLLSAAIGHFTHLTSLILALGITGSATSAEDNPRMSAILSCPSLPYLTSLSIWSQYDCSGFPPPMLLKACTNLRRLKYSPPKYLNLAYHALPDRLEVATPEKLETLLIHNGYIHGALAPLFTCRAPLVVLKLSGLTLRIADYSLVDQLIRTSSRSLRAVSLHNIYCVEEPLDGNGPGRLLLRALLPCKSLRFLDLGTPVFAISADLHVIKLLASLPIEFLSLRPVHALSSNETDELMDRLRLLPSLLAITFYYRYKELGLITSKFKNSPVILEASPFNSMDWPPPFEDLLPRTQELFRYRPYRASAFSVRVYTH
jgi:hypothetical protein